MFTPTVLRFPRNPKGRDLVVGDIHGCFSRLQEHLDRIGFDPERDRLFSTGDLVDRGPESHLATEWLSRPWFFPVVGNHELMACAYHARQMDRVVYAQNGGGWFIGMTPEERSLYVSTFECLPLLIEVDTDEGPVGIVHADVPTATWADLLAGVDGENAEAFVTLCTWSRTRINSGLSDCVEDWAPYYEWVAELHRYPVFDFAVIPDVIDGDEAANDALLSAWPWRETAPWVGAPVWHLHESLDRLEHLALSWPRVCLGSSGKFAQIGTSHWWQRMVEAMDVVCDRSGRPVCKLHGLRMLNPDVFSCFPFASADSTNIARNVGIDSKWTGSYTPPSKESRAQVMRDRIESRQSLILWDRANTPRPSALTSLQQISLDLAVCE